MLYLFILVIIELLVLTCMIVFDILEIINYINTIKHYKESIKLENDMRSFVNLRDNLYQERANDIYKAQFNKFISTLTEEDYVNFNVL